jgi:hypothetical protein
MKTRTPTSPAKVAAYNESAAPLFSLQRELKELAKKKPDATLSKSKVDLINKVLIDLLEQFKGEPGGKYLTVLDDEQLPQYGDAVLMVAQFASVLNQFHAEHYGWDGIQESWLTESPGERRKR